MLILLLLLKSYRDFVKSINCFQQETFNYSELTLNDDSVSYKGIQARHIIFAEGFGIHSNPFFKHLPLDGTKGELLVIKASGLDLDVAVNASIFILPIG